MEPNKVLHLGMAGLGMIFEETYLPVFLACAQKPIWISGAGPVACRLDHLYSRTGNRGAKILAQHGQDLGNPGNHATSDPALPGLEHLNAVMIATPDNRHFQLAKMALEAGKHVLIEKPSVLSLQELDELQELAQKNNCLARVVYHKLLDPDHKRLRTLVHDGTMRTVRSGYASLLEPRQISSDQFSEWISGRNPGTYVAVHYVKLIDFTFGPASGQTWELKRITATGQRGLAGPPQGNTWDSVQLRIEYAYPDGREAAFDIHTSWVNPDCFPGYVDQEVQFRFENATWLAHQRKRGVELSIEGLTPQTIKETPNHHYNADLLEPWNERHRRGYGLEVIHKFLEDLAYLEFGGPEDKKKDRLFALRKQAWCDLSADRNTVATVQAMEAILDFHAKGAPGACAFINSPEGGISLRFPGSSDSRILYTKQV